MIFNLLERHRDKWVEDGDCYRWIGSVAGNAKDRPQVKIGGKSTMVCRVMCEEVRGPRPSPKHLSLHDTRNGCIGGLCVNGEHLRWGTQVENMQDIPPEVRSERIRKQWRKKSPEDRLERSRKTWATRRIRGV